MTRRQRVGEQGGATQVEPRQLRGAQIPAAGRIVAVADVLTSALQPAVREVATA